MFNDLTKNEYNQELKDMLNALLDKAKQAGCSISIAVCSPEGDRCHTAIDASGADIAYMAAEQLFAYCKQESMDSKLHVSELASMSHKELTTYLNVMIEEDIKQMRLLHNPQGRA